MSHTLILLHGALGSTEQVEPLAEQLNGEFDVYKINFSGHGGRDFEPAFSISQFTQDLKHFIEAGKLQKPYIFGFSMGGYVALNLARLYPEMAGKIFTLGTKFNWTPDSAAREIKMLDPEKIEEKVPAFAEQLRKRHDPLDWKKVLNETAAMMISLGNGDALTLDQFGEVKAKVLITVGQQDNMVSKEESEAVAEAIPEAGIYIFPEFKHPIEQVDVKILAQKIKSFLL